MNNLNDKNQKIIAVDLDDSNLPIPSHEVLQERRVAIFDLLSDNFFKPNFPKNYPSGIGPYRLHISIKDQLLVFKISNVENQLIREINENSWILCEYDLNECINKKNIWSSIIKTLDEKYAIWTNATRDPNLN